MKNARQIAFEALNKIDKDLSYSNLTVDAFLQSASLSANDSALVSALVYGVLERSYTIDYCLSQHLRQPLKKLKPQVLTALRLGTYQLLFMNRIPPSAAVNESVSLVRNNGCSFASGLANAVLRAISREGYSLPDESDKSFYYSIKYSFPKWLVELWIESYGEDNAVGIMSSCAGRPPLTVRVNTIRTKYNELIETLAKQGITAKKTQVKDALNLEKCGSVEKIKAFEQGLFHVQDAASQLCAAALDPQPGDTVLDLCSAPGGKAFTAAQLMNNTGRIIACDIHSHRLALIKEGANRLGVTNLEVMMSDASVYNEKLPKAQRVLCDVPCSGLGIIRRKPEIRAKEQCDIDKLPALQYNILNSASAYVLKGGRLIYSTCSLNPAENEKVCERFVSEHSDFSVVTPKLPCGETFTRGGFTTLMPHLNGTDGFFIAAFERSK